MGTGLWHTYVPSFVSLSWYWRFKKPLYHLSPHLGRWRMLKVPDWCLAYGSWFEYGHQSLIHLWFKFWFSILILKVQRHPCPLNPDLGLWRTLEAPDCDLVFCSWYVYGYWYLMPPSSKFWLSFFILKVQRTSISLKGFILGFGGHWRFLTGVWHLNLNLDMVTCLWYTYDQHIGSLS